MPIKLFSCALCLLLSGCGAKEPTPPQFKSTDVSISLPEVTPKIVVRNSVTYPIVSAAKSQIGITTTYDPAYVGLAYPGGDVSIEKGVCTDVIVRALRDALHMDLQQLVHEDMKTSFSKYPALWGLKRPDRNIDHRRVPNLKKYFERHDYSLPISQNKDDYLPGDLVTCTVGRNLAHIMIVSNKRARDGIPLIIHNIGGGTQEENRLFEFSITGHYRIK